MKQIPKHMTAKEIDFFKKPRTMAQIATILFKGNQWAANHFQNDMINSKQLVLNKDGKISLP